MPAAAPGGRTRVRCAHGSTLSKGTDSAVTGSRPGTAQPPSGRPRRRSAGRRSATGTSLRGERTCGEQHERGDRRRRGCCSPSPSRPPAAARRPARARAVVDGAGGYPAAPTTDRDPEGHERSRLVLRVPPAEYDAVLVRLARLGTVVSRQISAKDVTGQVVDVDSRVRTQRASVARVRALMEKAASIGDIVSLESELSRRQADLESLEAQLKSLKDRTAMATVTLLLRQPDAAPDGASDDDTRSFGDALSGGWRAFLAAVKWLLVALGAVLPFAVAVGLLYGLWRLVRDRLPSALRRRNRAADTRDQPGPAVGKHAADDGPADVPRDPDRTVPAGEGDRGPR
ncbi:DUF4349 domain-containing protein [Streptomyces endophytica]|uniref:DUF4349 domain-containing protein n=1 Tax=Streptomyces endophytica TaxID=2991496 RepID=A0ABY6PIT9_9ACTN|nr:DUF4349 domain-containing protein [Streptomyces endophytica]UZJ33724.1 DUF4349 domain-containing protein [Streptomyces endophytica]